jgi:hypothetical protein
MKGISPLTLGLILLALPVLGWLWWTSEDTEEPVAVVARREAPAQTAPAAEEVAPRGPRRLPPIETFSVMIDRPLFAATRRPPAEPEQPQDFGETMASETEPGPVAPLDEISDRYRLIGTVEENGRVTALLAGNNGSFVRVRRGDRLDNWTVGAINRQRVLMVSGERATELTLVPTTLP